MATAKAQLCARSREWASLRSDGELSELETALLEAHLGRCAECRAFADNLSGIVSALRSAALERTAPIEFSVPRAGRRRRVLPALVAVALVALAALVGSLVGVAVHTSSPTATSVERGAVAAVAAVDTPDQLRRLRRTVLLDTRKIPRNLSGESA